MERGRERGGKGGKEKGEMREGEGGRERGIIIWFQTAVKTSHVP